MTGSESPAFGGTAVFKSGSGSSRPVDVRVGTCLEEGGSILAVDVTGSTGNAVQLVGSLVAQPTASAIGLDTYLFRGEITRIAGDQGDGLPWGLPSGFVAEVQVQGSDKTASLSVVFMQSENQVTVDHATSGSTSGSTAQGGSASDGKTTSPGTVEVQPLKYVGQHGI